MTRAMGARDLGLTGGTRGAVADRHGRGCSPGVLADATHLAATLAAGARLAARPTTATALVAGATVAGLALAVCPARR